MPAEAKIQRAFWRGVLVSILVAIAASLGLTRTRVGEWLESGAYDARMRLAANPTKADPRIVIIDIDNASLAALQDKIGRWPWTRRVWSVVIHHVSEGQPRAIALDMILAGRENDAVDAELAGELKKSGKVVLGFAFVSTAIERESGAGESQPRIEPQGQTIDAAIGPTYPDSAWIPHAPLETLSAAAAGVGSVNSTADLDAAIRREPIQFVYRGQGYPSLAGRTVEVATPGQRWTWHGRTGLLDSNRIERGSVSLPLDGQGRIQLLYHGNSLETYKRIPIWEVICSTNPGQCPNAEHSYPPEYFRDKIVFIAASAAGSYEARPTPFDAQAPGVIAHAAAVDNLLNGEAMRDVRFVWVAVLVVGFSLAGGLMVPVLQGMSKSGPILLALLAVYIASGYVAFRNAHAVLPVIGPAVALALSYSGASVARHVTTGRQLRRTRGVLDRYVAPQLVNYVMTNLDNIQLAGDKRELTILISDVRNFTTMTEKSDPMELIALLNDYLSAMTEIIFKYNGIVDKFIGDGILAYWGAFTPEQNHAAQASQAALEMLDKLKELNQRWAGQGKGPIAIGVGINTGCAIFGNIGRGKKMEFTVIGDAVNLAARLESLNKEFGTHILISEATRARLGEEARVRSLGGVKVKGKTVETQVFELQGYRDQGAAAADAAAKEDKVSEEHEPMRTT